MDSEKKVIEMQSLSTNQNDSNNSEYGDCVSQTSTSNVVTEQPSSAKNPNKVSCCVEFNNCVEGFCQYVENENNPVTCCFKGIRKEYGTGCKSKALRCAACCGMCAVLSAICACWGTLYYYTFGVWCNPMCPSEPCCTTTAGKLCAPVGACLCVGSACAACGLVGCSARDDD